MMNLLVPTVLPSPGFYTNNKSMPPQTPRSSVDFSASNTTLPGVTTVRGRRPRKQVRISMISTSSRSPIGSKRSSWYRPFSRGSSVGASSGRSTPVDSKRSSWYRPFSRGSSIAPSTTRTSTMSSKRSSWYRPFSRGAESCAPSVAPSTRSIASSHPCGELDCGCSTCHQIMQEATGGDPTVDLPAGTVCVRCILLGAGMPSVREHYELWRNQKPEPKLEIRVVKEISISCSSSDVDVEVPQPQPKPVVPTFASLSLWQRIWAVVDMSTRVEGLPVVPTEQPAELEEQTTGSSLISRLSAWWTFDRTPCDAWQW